MKWYSIVWALALLSVLPLAAQQNDATPQNWPHLDLRDDGYPGMSTELAYRELLNGKASQTVIVAVLDTGVDFDHEDLADNMWVNEDEIPGNGIDDDNNGYIDDIHGWNFIGGPDGRNVVYENLEIIRLYNRWRERYEGADVSRLSKSAREEYELYKEYEEEIQQKREELEPNVLIYTRTMEAFDELLSSIGKDMTNIKLADVKKQSGADGIVGRAAQIMAGFMEEGETFAEIYEQIESAADYYSERYNYNWNPDYDAREIVGDDPSDVDDRYYGNNDVEGTFARHGTHVAGIIGAVQNNGIGMDGVAANVKIMAVRMLPNGDERDKDVANAIRYAVDNGASVINMSFGKGASPYKDAVDAAVRYAVEHDVVLVHAAGNDHKENTVDNTFPNDVYERRGWFRPKYADTWIEVGAIQASAGEDLTADFSNWSADYVDVFAPGAEIYSTVPNDEYENLQGTSMAAPEVAGLAALIRSYFPDLTAEQVKQIIMDSTVRPDINVNKPGTEDVVPFSRLSVTGGVVNTYRAVQMAIQTRGRKKRAPERDDAFTPRA